MEKQKTFEVQPSCKWIDWAQLQWRSYRVSCMAKARANCLPPKLLLLLVVWLFNGSSSLASSLTGEYVAIISIAIKLAIEYSLYIVVISIKGQQGQPSQDESRPGHHLQLLLLLLLCLSAGCKPHNHLPLKNSCRWDNPRRCCKLLPNRCTCSDPEWLLLRLRSLGCCRQVNAGLLSLSLSLSVCLEVPRLGLSFMLCGLIELTDLRCYPLNLGWLFANTQQRRTHTLHTPHSQSPYVFIGLAGTKVSKEDRKICEFMQYLQISFWAISWKISWHERLRTQTWV